VFIPQHLINKTKFIQLILGHPTDEFGTACFVALNCDLLKLFSADTLTEKFIVNGCVVDGDEAIGLEEREQFVQKIVWILLDKLEEKMNIFVIEDAKPATQALRVRHDIACGSSKVENLVAGSLEKATAIEDVS
jgi:hypothetical protein